MGGERQCARRHVCTCVCVCACMHVCVRLCVHHLPGMRMESTWLAPPTRVSTSVCTLARAHVCWCVHAQLGGEVCVQVCMHKHTPVALHVHPKG